MPLTRVLVIGAAGNLGSLILNHLQTSSSNFEITVLTRESSAATQFPSSVTVTKIADDYPTPELVKAFTNVDVVIAAISMAGMHLQYRFIDAALAAKVKRYIPTEFGLDDLPDWLVELRPMFRIKHDVRDYLVSKEKEGLEWTVIVCNVFFEMGVMSGFFGFDWGEKKVTLIEGGDIKWVATTLDTVAVATVRALEKEKQEQTKNKVLLIQDFRTSQNEVWEKVKEVTNGGEGWKVEQIGYDKWLDEAKEKARQGDNSVLSKLTFGTVLLGSKWEERDEYANDLLGLKTKSFDEAIAGVLKDAK